MFQAILLDIFAKDWKVFTVAKVMAGLSGGFNSPCIMTYMSEVARPQYRGIMMSAAPVFLDFSAIIVAVVNEVVAIHTPLAYRRVFYSEFFMLGVWAIPLLLLPESPGECLPSSVRTTLVRVLTANQSGSSPKVEMQTPRRLTRGWWANRPKHSTLISTLTSFGMRSICRKLSLDRHPRMTGEHSSNETI